MGQIKLSQGKILKLSNVLEKEFIEDDETNFQLVIEQMDNYIKAKGYNAIGPLIQYMHMYQDEYGEMQIVVKFMRQVNGYIHNVELPYKMQSVIRVKNCMYARYIGAESSIKFAYDKIGVEAFENDIDLIGDSYTVFVDATEGEDSIIADIFMEYRE